MILIILGNKKFNYQMDQRVDYAFKLYKSTDDISARTLMLGSFIYLPLMQIIYVLDKYLMQ